MKNLIILLTIFCLGCSTETNKKQEAQKLPDNPSQVKTSDIGELKTDSASVNSLISELRGIEKFAVKDDYTVLAKLLKFKKDSINHSKVLELLDGNVRGYVEKHNPKAGFIKYNDFQAGDRVFTITYWNKSDGQQLIGKVEDFSDGMHLISSISFELYENGIYSLQKIDQVVPEKDSVYNIINSAIPEDLEVFSCGWVLPESGKNIKYCCEGNCLELIWNDGIFIMPQKNTLN